MAIIQFPGQKASPSIGRDFGEGLGQGLSSGIGSLIDMKLERMKKQQTVNELSESFKSLVQKKVISEDEAPMLANMSYENPQMARQYLSDRMEQMRNKQYAEEMNKQAGFQALQGLRDAPDQVGQQGAPQQQPQQAVGRAPEAAPYRYNEHLSPEKNYDMKQKHDAKIIKERELSQKDRAFIQAERKISLGETKKYREGLDSDADASGKIVRAAKKGLEIVRRRKDPSAAGVKQLFNAFGFGFEALKEGDEREFESLMGDIKVKLIGKMSGVKAKHIANIFDQVVPNRFQSQDQQERLLQNLIDAEELPIIKAKIKDQIMKEYEGRVPPIGLSGMINERMEPYYNNVINDLAEISGVESPVPRDTEMPSAPAPIQAMEAPKKTPPPTKPRVQRSTEVPISKRLKMPPKAPVAKKEKEPEGWFEWAGRNVARTAQTATASVLGFPGDMINIGRGMIKYAAKTVTGKDIEVPTPIAHIPGLTPFLELSKYGINKILGTKLDFPTGIPMVGSAKVKKAITDVTKILAPPHSQAEIDRISTPNGKIEAVIDNIVADVAPTLLFAGAGAVGKTVLRGLKVAGIGNAAGFLAKEIGAGEGTAAGVKLGAVLLTSLASPLSLKKTIAKHLPYSIEQDVLRKAIQLGRMRGMKVDKAFLSKINPVEVITNELQNASKISRFASKYLKPGRLNPVTGMMVSPLITTVMKGGMTGTAMKAAAAAYTVSKFVSGIGAVDGTVRMLSRYPALKKIYFHLIEAAARKDSVQLLKQVSNLDKAVKKKIKS